jgi:hypothetical protein
MASSGGDEIGGHGSKTTGVPSPDGGDIVGGYIKVSPIDVTEFTVVTNLGTLTQADFILTGTYYEYYNVNLRSVNSASVTGYTASINGTISQGDLIFEVVFHPTRLYAWTDPNPTIGENLYAWTVDPEDIKYFSDEFPFVYIKDRQTFTIPDNTIYTKTPIVDTSTNVYYLADDTELAITNIHFAFDDPYDSTSIVSADASTITINFER